MHNRACSVQEEHCRNNDMETKMEKHIHNAKGKEEEKRVRETGSKEKREKREPIFWGKKGKSK